MSSTTKIFMVLGIKKKDMKFLLGFLLNFFNDFREQGEK